MNEVVKQDWGALGPAMRALNERSRLFVEFYLLEISTSKNKDFRGAQAAAYRKAGFGGAKATPINMARGASRLLKDERMVAAIREQLLKGARGEASAEAYQAIVNMVRDPEHPGHARAAALIYERMDPLVTTSKLEVTHRHVDADQEALEELRALRELGVTREVILEQFGENGLVRLERLESADNLRRAQEAKVIDGEAVEIEDAPHG
jgi:hypothetical protein